MRKFRITIPQWEKEIKAEDEGYDIMDAESEFNFMNEYRSEEIEVHDNESSSNSQRVG